jgi:glycosyltransferase involved in cell wall biosynthesis
VVVVDNDSAQSGKDVVTSFKKKSIVNIDYYHEPVQNISLARNRAVRNATGDYIAFIDDDEFPEKDWLINLHKTLIQFNADGVLGPVRSHFENEPPSWISKSKILERHSFKTGTVIPGYKYTRTGNVLLNRQLFKTKEDYFDPGYGRIGGGDAIFFKSMMQNKKAFVWCDEAIVYETVTAERQRRLYYLKRAFTRGVGEAKHLPFLNSLTLKSFIAVCLYTIALPILFVVNHFLFMKFLIKDCDHLGKLLGYCGIYFVKQRPYED